MAMIRRKRKGKFTGNWILTQAGEKDVNLGTKDARVARDRAALAKRGEWPRDPVTDQQAAAGEIAAAMSGEALGGASEDVQEPLPSAPPVETGLPVEASKTSQGPVSANVSAEDVAAAAADVTDAEREMADAVGCSVDELRAEAAHAMECLPDAVAGAWLWLQGNLLSVGHFAIVGKKRKTRLLVPALASDDPSRKVLAVGAKLTLQQMNVNVTALPWWGVVLAGVAMTAAVQIKSAEAVPVESASAQHVEPAAPAAV
jgi:hypothetical protein